MQEQKMKTPFEAGVELYQMPKPEGDPDLIPEVRGLLVNAGISEDALANTFDLNRHIKDGAGRHSLAQRVQINRFLELVLLSDAADVTSLLSSLVTNSSLSYWLGFIEDKVAPYIAKRRLLV